MLTFDAESHSYFWNGVKAPGVTSILQEWVHVTVGTERYHVNRFSGVAIPSWKMEEASAKGKDIHLGAQLILQGGIDWEGLAEEYVAPLRQFEKWLAECQPNVLYTETAFYHPKLGYAGTIDIIAEIRKALAFIDIKTGASDTVGPQVAAYERGWCAENRYLGRVERYTLWLPKDGSSYNFEKLNNPLDFDFFKSCLFQRNFLKGVK
jgi:hypothetical protein